MRVGIFVQVCDREAGRTFGVEEVVRRIERVEALGFDSAWVMDHVFIERDGRRLGAHDPFVILAHAAARTRRLRLGTLVACAPFRPAVQLAREAAALADASGGRFVLGLGAGWHRPELEASGLPFDHLVSRFEEQVDAVRRLLAGGRHDLEGRFARLRGGEVPATAAPPPIWIAAGGPRMLRLCSHLADGWNLAWGGPDPSWLDEPLAILRRELEAAGRDHASFVISAGMLAPDPDAARLAGAISAYERAGFDELILSLSESPTAPSRPEWLERAAAARDAARG